MVQRKAKLSVRTTVQLPILQPDACQLAKKTTTLICKLLRSMSREGDMTQNFYLIRFPHVRDNLIKFGS